VKIRPAFFGNDAQVSHGHRGLSTAKTIFWERSGLLIGLAV
jgi:hypothetical protein